MNRGMNLFKSLFKYTALIFILNLWCSNVSAYVVNTTSEGAEIKWNTSNVTYYINTSGGPSGNLAAIQAAMQTWTDVVTSSFTFVYEGTTESADFGVNDGVNIAGFGPMGATGTLAENTTWYSVSSGEMIDSDIQFDTDYPWSTDASLDTYDVQNTGAHEFGHSLSLADLYDAADSGKTMYAYASPGETEKRTLDQDDIDGITYLYVTWTGGVSLSVRSAVVAPGDTVTIPAEISNDVLNVFGFQLDMEITPSADAPAITINAITKGTAATTAPDIDSNPLPPTTAGSVRIGLSTEIPATGDPRPAFDGPGAIVNVEFTVPASAVIGQSYQLSLSNVVFAGADNLAISLTVLGGAITVGGTTALADTIVPPATDRGRGFGGTPYRYCDRRRTAHPGSGAPILY